jgi:glycosyltransferase involved in cell wall biosynthesis
MAAERPVLVIADADSDVARVVIDAQAGIVTKSGDAESLAAAIVRAAAHPEREAGSRGRQYVLENAERKKVTGQYSDLLSEAVDRPHNGARGISERTLVAPGEG